jgi:integrase
MQQPRSASPRRRSGPAISRASWWATARSGHARETVPALRSFLRFCHLDGVIPSVLDGAVPAAGTRMSPLPKGIPDGDFDLLLASCDRELPRGLRDYAIQVLPACLGLRAGEVAAMSWTTSTGAAASWRSAGNEAGRKRFRCR